MKQVLGVVLCVVLTGSLSAADKIDAAKIVGVWEFVKTDSKDAPPPGTKAEFTKDGKVIVTIDLNGKELKIEGTYKITADKLTVTMSAGGKEKVDTDTIETLTDTKLVTVDDKKMKTEFKRAGKK